MKVLLNGKSSEIKKGIFVIDLLESFNLKVELTVVEINNRIIDKKNFNKTKLRENDRIEMIRFMGGGSNES